VVVSDRAHGSGCLDSHHWHTVIVPTLACLGLGTIQSLQVPHSSLRRAFPWKPRCEALQGAGRETELKSEVILGLII